MNQLIPSFLAVVQVFSPCFRSEVFETFQQMVCGWIVCAGRRTVSRVWESTGLSAKRNHATAFRLFSASRWNWDELCIKLIHLISEHLVSGNDLWIVADDTLCHKRGARVAFGGMFCDPVSSSKRYKNFCFANNWVFLGVVVKLPFRNDRYFCLPVLWRLYRKKQSDPLRYRTKNQLVIEMLSVLRKALPTHKIMLLGDDAYVSRTTLMNLPPHIEVLGPIDWCAVLYNLPTKDMPPQRKRGERLLTLREIQDNQKWQSHTVKVSLAKGQKFLDVKVLDNVLWYRSAGNKPLQVILIHDPSGVWRDEALVTSDINLSPQEMIAAYCRRWSVEVTFFDAKQQLGFQDQMVWTEKSVERAAPMSWFLHSLVIIWYATAGHTLPQAIRERPWYLKKTYPTFADMLATCRLNHLLLSTPKQSPFNPPCHANTPWILNYLATATYS